MIIIIGMDMPDFEKLVSEAIDNIPEMYQEKLKNVSFQVREEPSEQQREKLNLKPYDALFGLYEGVPLTQRGGAVHSIVPDVITIYRTPMVRMFTNKAALKKQVYETVWHEVAHYYGLNHERIHRAKKN